MKRQVNNQIRTMFSAQLSSRQLQRASVFGVLGILSVVLFLFIKMPPLLVILSSVSFGIYAYKNGSHRLGAISISLGIVIIVLITQNILTLFSKRLNDASSIYYLFFNSTVFIINILAPLVAWIWYLRWMDRLEPEPTQLLLKAFLWGMAGGFVAGQINGFIYAFTSFPPPIYYFGAALFDQTSVFSLSFYILLVSGGFIEEFVKYFFLKKLIISKPMVNQIADGAYYAMTLALGFSLLENISYFISFMSLDTQVLVAGSFYRSLFSTALHITATGFVGYNICRLKFISGGGNVFIYVIGAGLFHSMVNILQFSSVRWSPLAASLSFNIVVIALSFLIREIQKPENQKVWVIK